MTFPSSQILSVFDFNRTLTKKAFFGYLFINQSLFKCLARTTIRRAKSRFTYRSILKIKNVTKDDSMMYTCRNKEEMAYILQVHGKYFIL